MMQTKLLPTFLVIRTCYVAAAMDSIDTMTGTADAVSAPRLLMCLGLVQVV